MSCRSIKALSTTGRPISRSMKGTVPQSKCSEVVLQRALRLTSAIVFKFIYCIFRLHGQPHCPDNGSDAGSKTRLKGARAAKSPAWSAWRLFLAAPFVSANITQLPMSAFFRRVATALAALDPSQDTDSGRCGLAQPGHSGICLSHAFGPRRTLLPWLSGKQRATHTVRRVIR